MRHYNNYCMFSSIVSVHCSLVLHRHHHHHSVISSSSSLYHFIVIITLSLHRHHHSITSSSSLTLYHFIVIIIILSLHLCIHHQSVVKIAGTMKWIRCWPVTESMTGRKRRWWHKHTLPSCFDMRWDVGYWDGMMGWNDGMVFAFCVVIDRLIDWLIDRIDW